MLVGNIAAYIGFFLYAPLPEYCILGCAVMFLDWFIQYTGIRQSTNIRRLITGIIGGYSLTSLYCLLIKYAYGMILQKL